MSAEHELAVRALVQIASYPHGGVTVQGEASGDRSEMILLARETLDRLGVRWRQVVVEINALGVTSRDQAHRISDLQFRRMLNRYR